MVKRVVNSGVPLQPPPEMPEEALTARETPATLLGLFSGSEVFHVKVSDWQIYAPDSNFHVFLEIQTDQGVSGFGAAYSQREQVIGALGWLKRFVMNENPLEIERVTEKLHQITFWLGRGGAMTHAISAVNLALWDATGKILGQPAHVLLGGKLRDSVPVYGSVLFHPVDTLSSRIESMLTRGFRAIKLGWDPFGKGSLKDDENLVAVARRHAGGDTTLMIDAGGSYPFWPMRLKDALERAKMLADNGIYWFEEPLAPDDLEGYERLTELSPVKIAHGEVLTRRQSYVPYFTRRAMDIAQPDASKVGGLSEARRIAWMAEERGIEVIPHGWNTAIGVAADLQLTSTLNERPYVEFNVGNRLVEDIASPAFVLDEAGCLPVPASPGLGVEIDTERLRQLEAEQFTGESWTWDETGEFEAP